MIHNAIRTSGHLFSLANTRSKYYAAEESSTLSLVCLCSKFLIALGTKIDQAILDVTNISEGRSWKHRLNAKKQAWGACQAFAPILQFSAEMGGGDGDLICNSIAHLVNCVENCHQINQKITIGAMNSLEAVEIATWKSLPARNGIRGRCLAACLTKVELKSLSKSLQDQMHVMIERMLFNAHALDAHTCLSHDDLTQEHVHYLYGWMVANDVGSDLFELFSTVIIDPSIEMDVSLVQRFQSRAIYAARKRRLSGNLDELEFYGEDSEEDEL